MWGGYAYGRGLDGRAARRGDMEIAFRRIAVAAKNVDTREHDLVDADDYFQYHGGMVAMVRHLTGASPEAYVGDSAVPDQVKTRTLGEETHRVFRARVVNPRWMAAMRRHGYKGAFEMAATVDYLFGYDATAGVVDDWMYEKLSAEYVFDAENRDFMEEVQPWALRSMAEQDHEAADRGLWAEPDADTLERLRATYLELEGDWRATTSEYPVPVHGRGRPGRPAARAAAERRVARRGRCARPAARRARPVHGRTRPVGAHAGGGRRRRVPVLVRSGRARPGLPRRSARAGRLRDPAGPHGRAARRCLRGPARGCARHRAGCSEGVKAFEPGLLAAAHRGILYVDEVNLLHDHLVDLLLDAAAMGASYVEREGVSVRHAARFLLVGTMNPEEGELRPQLLDRFGLTVEVAASGSPISGSRSCGADSPTTRTRHDGLRGASGPTRNPPYRARIVAARQLLPSVRLGDPALRQIAATCAAFEVDGMRADIVMARTATALAAWGGTDRSAGGGRTSGRAARAAAPAAPQPLRRAGARRGQARRDAGGVRGIGRGLSRGGFFRRRSGRGPGSGRTRWGWAATSGTGPGHGDSPAGDVPAQGEPSDDGRAPAAQGAGEQLPVRAAEPFRTEGAERARARRGRGRAAFAGADRARTDHRVAAAPRGAHQAAPGGDRAGRRRPISGRGGGRGAGLVVRRDDLRQATRGGA